MIDDFDLPEHLQDIMDDVLYNDGYPFDTWGFQKGPYDVWQWSGTCTIDLEHWGSAWAFHITLPNGYVVEGDIVEGTFGGFLPDPDPNQLELFDRTE